MSEPSRALFLAAHQRYPIAAAAAKPFPNIKIAFRPSSILWTLNCCTCCCRYTMSEAFIVPESRVLEHEPTTRLAETTPALSLVAMTTHPTWGVKVPLESQILFVWNEITV